MSTYLRNLESSSAEAPHIRKHEHVFANLRESIEGTAKPSPAVGRAMALVVKADRALIWADNGPGDRANVVSIPEGMAPSAVRDALYGPADCVSYIADMHRAILRSSTAQPGSAEQRWSEIALRSSGAKLRRNLERLRDLAARDIPVLAVGNALAAMDDLEHDLLGDIEPTDGSEYDEDDMPTTFSHVRFSPFLALLEDHRPHWHGPFGPNYEVVVYVGIGRMTKEQMHAMFFARDPYARRCYRAACELLLATYAARHSGGVVGEDEINLANVEMINAAEFNLSESMSAWKKSEFFIRD